MIPAQADKSMIPHKPGVYLFKDKKEEVLYVGKAIDLYSRISSYFSKYQISPRIYALTEKIHSVDTIVVESELEALILEANLIKKYLPSFNIRLTDDKDYLYIKVTREAFPKITTARKQQLFDAKQYFGPFPSAKVVRDTLRKLRRIFPWCAHPPTASKVNKYKYCFYYHLKLCPGPCVGKIDQKGYNIIINQFIKFMEGKKDQLVDELKVEMSKEAKNLEYEKAAELKKMLNGLEYITQPNKASIYLENPNFLEEQRQISLEFLQKDLNLPKIPTRIESFDVSNIQGKQATGSMVVLTDGEIDKSQYRKFKIKIQGRPNDCAMMAEVVARRLKNDWPLADLIVVDGGRGQVKVVKKELDKIKRDIPVFGLAKRLEWLYPADGAVVKLPKSSLSLRLLQKIRDEAHRFALNFHRKLRDKLMYNNFDEKTSKAFFD